jgi:hypothetical protein
MLELMLRQYNHRTSEICLFLQFRFYIPTAFEVLAALRWLAVEHLRNLVCKRDVLFGYLKYSCHWCAERLKMSHINFCEHLQWLLQLRYSEDRRVWLHVSKVSNIFVWELQLVRSRWYIFGPSPLQKWTFWIFVVLWRICKQILITLTFVPW